MLYLSTSRATLQTKCKKGSLHIRRSILFWKQWISCRAPVPSWYLWGFLTFPALRNSFWGALPPTVGKRILLAGSSLPNVDGPASTAIWANCQLEMTLVTSPPLPTLLPFQFSSPTHFVLEEPNLRHWEVYQCWGFLCLYMHLCHGLYLEGPFTFPHSWHLFCSCHAEIGKRESANKKPEQSHESHVASILNF